VADFYLTSRLRNTAGRSCLSRGYKRLLPILPQATSSLALKRLPGPFLFAFHWMIKASSQHRTYIPRQFLLKLNIPYSIRNDHEFKASSSSAFGIHSKKCGQKLTILPHILSRVLLRVVDARHGTSHQNCSLTLIC
jgi:hypothetical protein